MVCRLRAASVPDIVAIEAESNTPPWSSRSFGDEFKNEHSRTYGSRFRGGLTGFLVVHVVEQEAHIVNFGVARAFRGQGIGRALLTCVIDELQQEGVRWITLEVRRSNTVAQRLYSSVGFFEAGVRAGYYLDNQEDALLLRLDLPRPRSSSSSQGSC